MGSTPLTFGRIPRNLADLALAPEGGAFPTAPLDRRALFPNLAPYDPNQTLAPDFTQQALQAQGNLTMAGPAPRPILRPDLGPGAYEQGGTVYNKPSKAKRILGKIEEVLAAGIPGGPERVKQEAFYGPYSQAAGIAAQQEEERQARLKELGGLASESAKTANELAQAELYRGENIRAQAQAALDARKNQTPSSDSLKALGKLVGFQPEVLDTFEGLDEPGRISALAVIQKKLETQDKTTDLSSLAATYAHAIGHDDQGFIQAITPSFKKANDKMVEEVFKAIGPEKPAKTDEKARYLDITSRMKLKDPTVTADDRAFVASYEQEKKLVPTFVQSQVSSRQESAQSRKSYEFHSGALDKLQTPIDSQMDRISRITASLNQNDPLADALIAPELLTAMAGGQGSGLRMNEAEISRIVGGVNNWQALKSQVLKWQADPNKPFQFLPPQRAQARRLIEEMSRRLIAKQNVLYDARKTLIDSDEPKDHEKAYADARKQLSSIDQQNVAAPAATGLPKVGETFQGKKVLKIEKLK